MLTRLPTQRASEIEQLLLHLVLQLQNRYPHAFPTQGDGIQVECGDGWYTIIESLCYLLSDSNQRMGQQPTHLQSVKEKLGTLRVLVAGQDPQSNAWIKFAERHSAHTCELCGCQGQLLYEKGWQRVRCESHLHEPSGAGSPFEL
ncbi:hypothetical protein [Pseudomonas syringae]|uniref:hypothetical protein n=1 Tax=Pseudomonas syringae TaxID=317 RepID=UPI001F2FE11A|nr:hypothetical protein [Pseudomonas syringae]MCF5245325.1 hypothetical protein [Pseudomonas syringae]